MPGLLVIPSIDIKDGKTIRVVQGIPELQCSAYGDDPIEMAMIWRAENAKCIHVVDFDAAQQHSHQNFDIIAEICESVIVPVQLGGGIRTYDDAVEAMSLGVFRLVIGTMALEEPTVFKKVINKFGPQLVAAAIDVIDEEVVVGGRKKKTGISVYEYSKNLTKLGAERFIITDVKRNGMMLGPNVELSKKVAEITKGKVTLSGGISGYPDLVKVQEEFKNGIDSVIIGRALYENRFPCQKIWRVAESGIFN